MERRQLVHGRRIWIQPSRQMGWGVLCREAPFRICEEDKKEEKTPGNGDGGSTSETPQPPRKRSVQADPTVESEEAFKNRMEVNGKIPKELHPWLVED